METELTIDRIENNQAVLKTLENETIIWPAGKLPPAAREGMALFCQISLKDEKAKTDKILAKNILNEILGAEN